MAEEITVSMRLEYMGLLMYSDLIAASGLKLDSTNDIYSHAVTTASTVTSRLLNDNIVPGQWLILVNRSETATLSLRSGASETDMVELQPLEPCCFRLGSASVPYLTSTESGSVIEYLVLGSTFLWSGEFGTMAGSADDLKEYLGAPALGGSHLWQAEALTSVDDGSLGDPVAPMVSTTATVQTNSKFGGGSRNTHFHNVVSDNSETAVSWKVPASPDGTQSFLVGGIVDIDSLPVSGNSILISEFYGAGTVGWIVLIENTGANAGKVRFSIYQAPTAQHLYTLNAITPGTPFVFLANLDIAGGGGSDGMMKVVTSVDSSYAEAAWTDSGTFDGYLGGCRIGRGEAAHSTLTGFIGTWAQMFTFQYPGATDLELSQSNMTSFLKYSDGILTV